MIGSKEKKRLIKLICLVTFVLILVSITALADTWSLSGSVGCHDPAITKEGSTWYVFSTGTGISLKKSTNGLTWTECPRIFSSGLSWWKTYVPGNSGNDVWAPDIQYFNGRWWLFYSISTFGSNTSCIGLASCASNLGGGSWRDDGLVIRSTSSNGYNCIDPNLFIDPSGNPWLVFGSWFDGIKLTRLDNNTMKPTGSIYSLAKRSGGIEAPILVYQDGYYYLFVSIDVCCNGVNSTYKITYGRSTSITGPYLDKNGVNMSNGGNTVLASTSGRWVGPGGQSIYNNNVLAYHAYDANANGASKLMINDLYWSNGWPTLTGSGTSSTSPVVTPTPTPTSSTGVIPQAGMLYSVVNRNSGKLLEVVNASTANGANVQQWTNNSNNSQRWRLEDAGGGYYRLVNVNSGQLLEVVNALTTNGANVQQWPANGHNCQQWRFQNAGNGFYYLENRNSGKVLDVSNRSTADGGNVVQWTNNGGTNQQWKFVQ